MKPTPQAVLEETRELEPLYIRALVDSKTIDKERRTVEVTFATDTPVLQRTYSWSRDQWISYNEILSMSPEHVRMQRLENGAPLLDNHDRYSGTKSVLGVVERAWLVGGQGRAVVRFSKRADVEDTWQDVQDGILKGISVGYRVFEYEITQKEGEIDSYRAIDWEPFEVSIAPIQADINSQIRTAKPEKGENVNTVKIRNAAPATENRNANLNPHNVETKPENTAGGATPAAGGEAQRSAQPQAQQVDTAEIQKTAVENERKRSKEIKEAVRAAKLETSFADELIDAGHSVDKARELIIKKFAEADPANGSRSANTTATVTADAVDKRRAGMEQAIVARAVPGAVKAEELKGSEYRGMTLIRLAEDALTAVGVNTRGMSNSEIARAALNLRSGMHSTSDFPVILGNTINRRLQAEYALAPQTFTEWCQRGSVSDFREVIRANMSEIGDFKEVKEGGEYKSVTLGEGSEKYKVAKYGEKIGITWETLVNDDLSAFNRLPAKIAQAARRKQSDIVYAILTANAAMGDSVALFHASHGNLGTNAAITIDSLAEMRKLARKQKGKADKDFLNLALSWLMVGPDKEKEAIQYMSSDYLPNTQSQINPYKSTKIIVEPRLTGNQWYMGVNPGIVDTVEYSFLEGEELMIDQREGWDVDGVEIKARMVFGAKALDWKGLYKNAGA